MKKLEVCFVGIGSIAKRHIKNLYKVCQEDGVKLYIDAVTRSGIIKDSSISSFIRRAYSNENELEKIYDAVFITNPTELHIETLEKMTYFGKNFFIEKPIASIKQLENAMAYRCKEDSVYYVACPLRYNAVIQYIKNNIDPDTVISVRSVSSSYLPDWRQNQDYRDTYSAHKDLGGGVSIDLIHEWDYLSFLFGNPEKVQCYLGKKSNLEIDSEDYAIYIAEYEDKIVELHLDYFGRKTIREVMLFTNDDTIVGDIANNKITFLKSGKHIDFKEERDDYQKRELRHFLNLLDGNEKQDSTIEHAINVLKLTQGEI